MEDEYLISNDELDGLRADQPRTPLILSPSRFQWPL
jgi:hypothetical protein